MKRAESIIKGIDLTIEGLNLIKSVMLNTSDTEKTTTETTAAAPETAPASGGDSYTTAELSAMPYNKFKTFAAKLGVKCTGTRDDIMGRIRALGVISDADTAPAETEPEDAPAETATPKKKGKLTKKSEQEEEAPATPAKSDKSVGGKRGLTKKTAEPAPDEFDEQAKAIADDTSVEDIIAALAEAGVTATKKNYLEKLAHALREGLIEPEDEGDSEAEANTAAEPEGDDEDDTNYTSEFDPEGFNDPSNMSYERHEAVATLVDEIITDYSEKNLTAEDMTKFLEENCTQEELDLLEDPEDEDALLNFYIEMKKRFIDNEGETHENEDPYELGDHDMCCGHVLKHNKKSGKYICEMCGGEYEAE